MATANFTGGEQQKTFHKILCSAGLTDKLSDQLVFLSVLNTFLSVTAFLGNALILIALHKEPSVHWPSKLLLRSLAAIDHCVGFIAAPLAVAYWMSVVKEHWKICAFLSVASFIASYILCGVSVATLTAISVDRLLALLSGLRYRQMVTVKQTFKIVIIFWVIATAFSAMWFSYGTIGIPLYLITLILPYTKIFFTLSER